MNKISIIKFLEQNNIKYELKEGKFGQFDIYLPEYKNVINIQCYYDNCEIVVREESNVEIYDCNKYLKVDFLENYRG